MLTKYTLTSGTVVVIEEPSMADVEKAMRLVPAGVPARQAFMAEMTELVRLNLRSVNGKPVTYKTLQGDGLAAAFPGAVGVRDVSQVRDLMRRLTTTTDEQDAAVFRSAEPAEEPQPARHV